ncbi:FxLD family lanthipeptide [Nonomuraea sp. NPDC050547]|uniref:FxLD family lanthipeptide n=1 Tax=unclassified Nonomuraea TaxID=2593643 RepID=UPI00378D4B88
MSTQLALSAPDTDTGIADWEFDVAIVEAGPEADRLIRMTDDGCGQTCASACPNTCK